MPKFLLKFEAVLFWSVLILLVFIPLYPKFPLANIHGTFVAIRLEDFLIAAILALWGVFLIFSRQWKSFFTDKLNQTLLLFFFISGVSVFAGIFLTHTVELKLGIFHYLRRIELMLLLPFAYTAIKSKKQILTALMVLSGVVLIVNLYALGQQYLGWPVISTTNSEFSKGLILRLTPGARVNSTFAGHYDLAVFLVMVITLISALFFSLKKLRLQIWYSLLGVLSFVVLVMTAARLSFAAVIVGVTASLILTGKKIFILLLFFLVVAALVYPSQLRDRFISTITVNVMQEGQRYFAQTEEQNNRSKLNIPTLSTNIATKSADDSQSSTSAKLASDIAPGEPTDTTQLGVYRSFTIRLRQEWPRAIRAFVKDPLLGTGFSSLGLASDNDFLRSLGEVGILGTLAFSFILIEVFKRIWSNYKTADKFLKYFSAGIFSLVIAFLVNALFIDVFESSKIATLFWLILGVNLAVKKFA